MDDVIDFRTERSERFSQILFDTKLVARFQGDVGGFKILGDVGCFVQTLPAGAQYLLPGSVQEEGALSANGLFVTLSLGF